MSAEKKYCNVCDEHVAANCDVCQRYDAIKSISNKLFATVLIAGGLVGMHYAVEYSGWAIFAGIILL